ncbi:Ubiquitin-specific protease UBP14 [Pseudoloma neurophilia]|uniref:Ubiquitin-specific protease UBP14 n=1 Tax=Pseudoloma neurophilia TaxID=146866 RepID=A0A0R0LY52_9MICR|nr:Ubiquitin-specific protease UBP14 [Pseudoloma neurophilia]
MTVYLPNLLYTTTDCTFCYRSAESICICSLAFCSVHAKLHIYGDHKTALLIKNKTLFYDDAYKIKFSYQNNENTLIDEILLRNLLDQKAKLPICIHVQEFEQQLVECCSENNNSKEFKQKLVECCSENNNSKEFEQQLVECCSENNNSKEFEQQLVECCSENNNSKEFEQQLVECCSENNNSKEFEQNDDEISCCKCPSKDPLICLSCLFQFCPRELVLSDGKAHMKEHFCKMNKITNEVKNSKMDDNSETNENYDHYFNNKHDLAIRDKKIFCYSCDRQVFSPLLFLILIENNTFLECNKYVQNLKQKVKKLDDQNSALYTEQNNLIKMNNEQEKLLFGYDGNDHLYHMISEIKDVNSSENIKNLQPDTHFVRGIVNEGNTCYLNTALQLLADVIKKYDQDQHIREQHLLSGTNDIRKSENILTNYNNFYQQDPLFCLKCQLFKVLTSLRPVELTLSETFKKIDDETVDHNLDLTDNSGKKSPSIYDLDESKKPTENYILNVKNLPSFSISPLLHLLSANDAIKLGMQQDSAEILGWLIEKIGSSEKNEAKKTESYSDLNDCMSKSLDDLIFCVFTYKDCMNCKTRFKSKEKKIFLLLSDLTSGLRAESCEKCGNETKISIFYELAEYLLIYNKYDVVYGEIVMKDVQKEILINSNVENSQQKNDSKNNDQTASETVVESNNDIFNSECFLTLQAMGYSDDQILQVLEITQDLNLALDILSQGQMTVENCVQNGQLDTKNMSIISESHEKSEEFVDYNLNLHDLHPEARLKFFSGIKYGNVGSVLGIVGHYVYHKNNLIIDDDKIRFAVEDDMLYKGHILIVYRTVK